MTDSLKSQPSWPTILLRHVSPSVLTDVLSDLCKEIKNVEQEQVEGFAKADILVELLQHAHRHNTALSLRSEDESLRALSTFAYKILRSRSQDGESEVICKLANLCAKFEPLLETLIERCTTSLRTQAHILASGMVGSVLQNKESSEECQSASYDGLNDTQSATQVTFDASLAFLKTAAWRGQLKYASCIESIIEILMLLVGHASLSISNESKNTICAIFSSYTKEDLAAVHTSSNADTLCFFHWDRIVELTDKSCPAHCKANAYAVWLQALSSFHPWLPTFDQQHDARYWGILHRGLAHGSLEQRKICLAIAKISVSKSEHDISNEYHRIERERIEDYNACFAKFCTLYETVSSRYLNQVRECVPDLSLLAKTGSSIHKAWLVALLTSALGPGNQESIRQLIGNWTLKKLPEIATQCINISPVFLAESFLPWATTGFHFTTSVVETKDNTPVCLHGEALVTCIRHLITGANVDGCQTFITAVLSFLDNQAGKIFSSARAYTLEGLRQGLKDRPLHLDSQCLDVLARIAFMGGFQDVMNDFMVFQCAHIAEHITCDMQDPRYTQLQAAARILRDFLEYNHADQNAGAVNSPFESPPLLQRKPLTNAAEPGRSQLKYEEASFKEFVSALPSVDRRDLKGHSLFTACNELLQGLEKSLTKDINPELLARAFDIIWDEFESQAYPKQTMMQLPALIFHPDWPKHCAPDTQLSRSLSAIVPKLQKLATNRVYAFAPFSLALRKFTLQAPLVSHLPMVDIFVNLATDPPSTKVEFRLAGAIAAMFSQEVPHRNHDFYLGKPAGYGYACIFDTLNRWPDAQTGVACQIIDKVLYQWDNQQPPIPVFSKWKATIQLQMVLIFMQKIVKHVTTNEVDEYLRKLYYVLSVEPLPRYRYLLEWIILRIYVQDPQRREHVLSVLDKPDLSNPKHVVSMIKIATMIALLPDTTEEYTCQVMLHLSIFAASPKIVLRHEAQWSFPLLWSTAQTRGWTSILNNLCFSWFNDFVLSLATYHNPPKGRLLEKFDPIKDHNLTHLVSGAYLNIEPREDARLCRNDFLRLWGDTSATANDNMIMPLGPESSENEEPPDVANTEVLWELSANEANGISIPLQIKANPTNLEALTMDAQSRRSSAVIVVASLIDSAYNLGGIPRACEIMGAGALYMRNPSSVLKEHAFSTVSVSSEYWLPIRDLKPESITSFLIEQKRQGFKVVGIEQTDSSKILGDPEAIFDEKTVLVLGGEREGIPARVLGDCDWCVEIEQIGITRSLNVQTATACVLYEYIRQRRRPMRSVVGDSLNASKAQQ